MRKPNIGSSSGASSKPATPNSHTTGSRTIAQTARPTLWSSSLGRGGGNGVDASHTPYSATTAALV
jgi:hypothetical protein